MRMRPSGRSAMASATPQQKRANPPSRKVVSRLPSAFRRMTKISFWSSPSAMTILPSACAATSAIVMFDAAGFSVDAAMMTLPALPNVGSSPAESLSSSAVARAAHANAHGATMNLLNRMTLPSNSPQMLWRMGLRHLTRCADTWSFKKSCPIAARTFANAPFARRLLGGGPDAGLLVLLMELKIAQPVATLASAPQDPVRVREVPSRFLECQAHEHLAPSRINGDSLQSFKIRSFRIGESKFRGHGDR